MTETRDPDEIVPLSKHYADATVVDLAGFRMTQGASNRSLFGRCKHRHLLYDKSERRVRCEDCKRDIDAFDALMSVTESLADMLAAANRRLEAAKAAEEHSLTSRAAKAVDDVWRRQKMAPCCPHCQRGILPEDYANGVGTKVGRDYELARRAKKDPT